MRHDTVSNEVWALLDDAAGHTTERWVCVSERACCAEGDADATAAAPSHQSVSSWRSCARGGALACAANELLALERVPVSGFFLNCYARHYAQGELPARAVAQTASVDR